jgi:hypothetical protein
MRDATPSTADKRPKTNRKSGFSRPLRFGLLFFDFWGVSSATQKTSREIMYVKHPLHVHPFFKVSFSFFCFCGCGANRASQLAMNSLFLRNHR